MRWSPLVTLVLVVCGNCTYAAIFPDSGPTTPGARATVSGEIAWRQLRRRLQLSGRFGRQINCAQNHIVMVADMPPFTTVVTIVREPFRMLSAVPG